MNDTTPLSDDPRLTSYALGELEGDERAAVEAALQSDPAAQEIVRQIRVVTSQLETAFASELAGLVTAGPATGVSSAPGATGLPTRDSPSELSPRVGRPVPLPSAEYPSRHERGGWGTLLRFPQFYFVASTAAAAAFAVMVIWRQPEFEAKARADALQLRLAQEQRMQARESARRSAAAETMAVALAAPADAVAMTDLAVAPASHNFLAPVSPMSAGTGVARGVTPPVEAASAPRMATATAGRSLRSKTLPAAAGTEHPFVDAQQEPASSFAIVVGTRSYPEARQALTAGHLPPAEAVRIEEWLNYFPYHYERPSPGASAPLAAAIEVAAAPWAPDHRLVRVGLQARDDAGRTRDPRLDGDGALVARDVSLQVEFDPAAVASYRLIGYESASSPTAEAGASAAPSHLRVGQTVTALYEVIPVRPQADDAPVPDPSRNDQPRSPELPSAEARKLLTLRVSFRDPAGENRELEFPATDAGGSFSEATSDFKFAAAVAHFGMQLRRSDYRGTAGFGEVIAWASAGLGTPAEDPSGLRGEFVGLVRRAQTLWH